MRLVFWFAEKGYELALGPALIAGAAAHGDTIEMRPIAEYRGPEGDGGIICGVVKREILWDHKEKGRLLVYMDKGYFRERAPWKGQSLPTYWRLVLNATHPTEYLMKGNCPPDRWERSGRSLRPRRTSTMGSIVILGSSAKFHHTEGLIEPTAWTQSVVDRINEFSTRTIVYRPKPSWADAQRVTGTVFDHGEKRSIENALEPAWCSVTYGSIACVDSILAGVPCIVLGNAVARSICSTDLADLEKPRWASVEERQQWISNLCYCHWTVAEIDSGIAWQTLKEQIANAV